MARISLVTYGSDGDILPMVVVARALARRGHSVQVCGPPEHSHRFEGEYQSIRASVRGWFAEPFSMRSPGRQLAF